MDLSQRIWQLEPVPQHYAWGKPGKDSAVANLLRNASVDVAKPYAELWMGTHVNGPSKLCSGKVIGSLSELIALNPELVLGKPVHAKFGPNLPYLLKVLSIAQPLSLQAHPDIALAKELHQSFPDIYKDPNHKPEIAIPVTPMRALCGFRGAKEIAGFLEKVPQLKAVVGEDAANKFIKTAQAHSEDSAAAKSALKDLFAALMTASEASVASNLASLIASKKASADPLNKLIYPGDIGIFSLYLLNFVELEVGEAIFLAANEPHAYISGDCIECMATSDNVVRAGLTPKFKDVKTLVRMLTYSNGSAVTSRGQEKNEANGVRMTLYKPPAEYPEFRVERFFVPPRTSHRVSAVSGAAILLVYTGECSIRAVDGSGAAQCGKGSILFVFAETPIEIQTAAEACTVFRASPNLSEALSSHYSSL